MPTDRKKKDKTSLTEKKRIFLVDDHPLYREGLKQYINKEPTLEVCGEAGNAVDAMELIRNQRPDLVIVDVSLGESSGIDLVKSIRSQNKEMGILVLSMHPDTLFAERALLAGARGYINKSRAIESIKDAIQTILNGRIYLSDTMTQAMLEKKSYGVSEASPAVDLLSDRELEVFEQIGNGKTTAKIAKNLNLSAKTIETYRANIKNKMSLENNTELIRHAVQWVQTPEFSRRRS